MDALGAATTTAPLITSAIRILLMKYLRDSQDAIYDASIDIHEGRAAATKKVTVEIFLAVLSCFRA
jgi:hypothetical protein